MRRRYGLGSAGCPIGMVPNKIRGSRCHPRRHGISDKSIRDRCEDMNGELLIDAEYCDFLHFKAKSMLFPSWNWFTYSSDSTEIKPKLRGSVC